MTVAIQQATLCNTDMKFHILPIYFVTWRTRGRQNIRNLYIPK